MPVGISRGLKAKRCLNEVLCRVLLLSASLYYMAIFYFYASNSYVPI